jgi:hypothetical protein
MVKAVLHVLLQHDDRDHAWFGTLVGGLPDHHQRVFLHSLLRVLSERHLRSGQLRAAEWLRDPLDAQTVAGAAKVISIAYLGTNSLENKLLEWLTATSGVAVEGSMVVRRAVIVALAQDEGICPVFGTVRRARLTASEILQRLLELALKHFGDPLYINHTPMLHQQGSFTPFESSR